MAQQREHTCWETTVHLSRPFPSSTFRNQVFSKSRPSTSRSISCFCLNRSTKLKRDHTSVMIVLTRVGAAIGGYVGNAFGGPRSLLRRQLPHFSSQRIDKFRVLTAAMLYWPMPNALYVEGCAFDQFAEGLWALQPVHQNKVGLVLDAGIEEELRIRHLQVDEVERASLDLPVVEYVVTDAPLEVELWTNPKSGQSTGRMQSLVN